MFVGHCKADDLVEHYNEFPKIMQLDSNYLLHIGKDGPNVNLSFESKLATNLDEMDNTFLRIGSSSLYPTQTAFRKGNKKFYSGKVNAEKSQHFDLNDFFNDFFYMWHFNVQVNG